MSTSSPKQGVGRFDSPKSNLYKTNKGSVVHGLPEKPSLRPLRQEFDQAKAEENERAAETMAASPTGRRFQSKFDFEEAITVERELQAGTAGKIARPAGRDKFTSPDHPLYNESYEERYGPKPAVKEAGFSKRVYDHSTDNTPPALKGQLDASLVPLESSSSRPSTSHASRPTTSQSNRPASKSSNMGSLDPDCKDQQELYAEDNQTGPTAEALQLAQLQSAADAVARQLELEQMLIEQYPHGVPKRLLQQMKAHNQEAINLPSLGFGQRI